MNWQTELNSSLSWILTALFWVVLCFSMVMIALKQTSFGQKFWHIASPSINRRNSIKIILMLLVLFTMILLEVRFSVLNSFFYNGLYSSMQELDADKFWFFAKLNALLVLVQVIHSIADYFLQQVFEIRWLESLNKVLVKRWLENKKYYRLKYEKELPDNIDQRIEQDAREFISYHHPLVTFWCVESFWIEYRKRCCLLYLRLYYPGNINVCMDWSSFNQVKFQ